MATKYWQIIADEINEHSQPLKIKLLPLEEYEEEEEEKEEEPDMDWADPTRER